MRNRDFPNENAISNNTIKGEENEENSIINQEEHEEVDDEEMEEGEDEDGYEEIQVEDDCELLYGYNLDGYDFSDEDFKG